MRPSIDPSLIDFNRAPLLVIWEVTRAGGLACVHCRADAVPRRDLRELTTEEGFQLINQVRGFSPQAPLLVLTGGDPMRRPDLEDLVRHAADAGLIVSLTASGTATATRRRLTELNDAGLSCVAVSLDGPDPDTHDAFRRVRGSFACTMRLIEATIDVELPLQINTTVTSSCRASGRWRVAWASSRSRAGRSSSSSGLAAARRWIRSMLRSARTC